MKYFGTLCIYRFIVVTGCLVMMTFVILPSEHLFRIEVLWEKLVKLQSDGLLYFERNASAHISHAPLRWGINVSIPKQVIENKYTIAILAFNRSETLTELLNYYGYFANAHKIVVIWNDPSTSIPAVVQQIAASVPVRIEFIVSKSNTLNNRFLPRETFQTQGNYIHCVIILQLIYKLIVFTTCFLKIKQGQQMRQSNNFINYNNAAFHILLYINFLLLNYLSSIFKLCNTH